VGKQELALPRAAGPVQSGKPRVHQKTGTIVDQDNRACLPGFQSYIGRPRTELHQTKISTLATAAESSLQPGLSAKYPPAV
jgi:hypothetical protein